MTKNENIFSKLKENPKNPRTITKEKFQKLKKSLNDFPKMLELRPIIYDKKFFVLGGNMRLKAIQELINENGFKVKPEYFKSADSLTKEEIKQFVIADNLPFGAWDMDILANEWEIESLLDWGFEENELLCLDSVLLQKEANEKLAERFIVPPFSLFDTRQGYWQKRKKAWRAIIGDEGESRKGKLGFSSLIKKSYGKLGMADVSILDATLAEVVCRWFNVERGSTFDPFAGDTVFGFVSAHLGFDFVGIDIRAEQCKLNNKRCKGMVAKFICDDGQNIGKHLKPESRDLLFSCPPYFDLEKYSELKKDASNQSSYADFLKIMQKAFTDSIGILKQDRFAVIVVADIRDKRGIFRCFPEDIKQIFLKAGMKLYNEIILLNTVGTAGIRASRNFNNRKTTKVHQNILVFYKGDVRNIKKHYKKR